MRNAARLPETELGPHYDAHRETQGIRAVNVDTLDSDAPRECEDWGGRSVALC